ncbi:hypothetical protein AMK27_39910 [Streptomyces sp. CB02009]|nr:hypothetical protein AMK27_39910 [Streptomyces sp. CB02009]
MPVAINAHQLGRMLSRTVSHIGSEFVAPLHGIRLEADDTYLYAMASDQYTIAVARYQHQGLDGEPFARTVPAPALRSLSEWTDAQHGSDPVTLTTAEGRLRLSAPHGELALAVTDGQKFFDWRGTLHGVLLQSNEGSDPFPVLDSRFLSRFAQADDKVRVRTADGRATLIVGEDFLGAQMPVCSRQEGFGAHLAEDVEQVLTHWTPTLTGAKPTAMPDGILAESRPRYEVTQDPAETWRSSCARPCARRTTLSRRTAHPRPQSPHMRPRASWRGAPTGSSTPCALQTRSSLPRSLPTWRGSSTAERSASSPGTRRRWPDMTRRSGRRRTRPVGPAARGRSPQGDRGRRPTGPGAAGGGGRRVLRAPAPPAARSAAVLHGAVPAGR